MKKTKLAIYGGIIVLSFSSLCTYKLTRDTQYMYIESEENKIEDKDNISIVAHRGLSSYQISNSKQAIESTRNKEYIDGVEFDVRLTKDDKLVLSHGDNIKLLNNDKISVSNSTLSSLENIRFVNNNKYSFDDLEKLLCLSDMECLRLQRQVLLLNKTGTIITLDDAISLIDDKKKMYIDLKFNNDFDELSSMVVNVLNNHLGSNFIIQSNNFECLKKMKQIYPEYKYHIIILDKDSLRYLDYDFDGYAIRYDLLSYGIIKSKVDSGKEISVWTIDDLNVFDKIIKYSKSYYDDINYITDYPDVLEFQYKKVKDN